MFEGIRGPSFEGDIAIDDVSITIGKCKQENTVASTGKKGKTFLLEGEACAVNTFRIAEMRMILWDLKCVVRFFVVVFMQIKHLLGS